MGRLNLGRFVSRYSIAAALLFVASTAYAVNYFDEIILTTPLAITSGGTGASTASGARTNLGLAIGSDVQAWDAQLDSLSSASANGVSLVTAANYAAMRALLDLEAGTDVQAWDADLDAIAAFSSTGFAARTASNTWAQRSLAAPADGFTITNPAGIAGNPTFVLADDLAALEGLASTGIAVRSAANTWVQRAITGTAAEITATNGNGVSGNPTLSLPSALTFTGKTITGGTYSSPSIAKLANLTGNGYVKTSGSDGTLGIQAVPIPVADGGTATTTAFTAGSMVFAGTSGVYSQDNASLFFDDSNNWFGLRTAAPITALTIATQAINTDGEIITLRNTDTGMANDQGIGRLSFYTDDITAGAGGERAYISALNVNTGGASELSFGTSTTASPVTEKMVIKHDGDIGMGISDPLFRLHIEKDGASSGIMTASYGTGTEPQLVMYGANGTQATPTATQSGDSVGTIYFQGFDTARASGATINAVAAAEWGTAGDGTDSPTSIFFTTTADGASAQANRMVIHSNGNVGIGMTSPQSALDIVGTASGGTLRLSNNLVDATAKYSGISMGHYTNAEEPIGLMYSATTSTLNNINIGGGHSSFNAATEIAFFTAANNTTTTGTQRMTIDTSGSVGIGTIAPTATLEVAGHIGASGTAPTLSSCGTSPSISGDDTAGYITTGTGATACTINFATAYASVPVCVVSHLGSAGSAFVSITTPSATAYVIDVGAVISFSYICIQ